MRILFKARMTDRQVPGACASHLLVPHGGAKVDALRNEQLVNPSTCWCKWKSICEIQIKEVKGNLAPSGMWVLSTFPDTDSEDKGKNIVRDPPCHFPAPGNLMAKRSRSSCGNTRGCYGLSKRRLAASVITHSRPITEAVRVLSERGSATTLAQLVLLHGQK